MRKHIKASAGDLKNFEVLCSETSSDIRAAILEILTQLGSMAAQTDKFEEEFGSYPKEFTESRVAIEIDDNIKGLRDGITKIKQTIKETFTSGSQSSMFEQFKIPMYDELNKI